VFKRPQLKNWRATLHAGSIVCLATAIYLMYYLLLKDKLLPFSISSLFSWADNHTAHWHIIAIAMLPIYLALMIFGTAIVGIYLGSAMQRWLARLLRQE
jgi:hypothetical protein